MAPDALRRFRLVTVPVTVLALGLVVAPSLTTRGERPDELVGLPGSGRLSPEPTTGNESASTPVTSTSTSTSTSPPAPTSPVTSGGPTRETVARRAGRTQPPPGAAEPTPLIRAPERPVPPVDRVATGTPPGAGSMPGATAPVTGEVTGTPLGPVVATPAGPADAVFTHTFPAGYEGPVWMRVAAPGLESRTIVIRWGPHQREITHHSIWAISYVFHKAAGPTVPTTVTVSDGAGVQLAFGEGFTLPLGSVDINDGWTTVPESP